MLGNSDHDENYANPNESSEASAASEAADLAEAALRDAVEVMTEADKRSVMAVEAADATAVPEQKPPSLDIRHKALADVMSLTEAATNKANAAKLMAERAEAANRALEAKGQVPSLDAARNAAIAREAADRAEAAAKRVADLEKDARKEHDAAMAAEFLLKVVGFFKEHKNQIYDRLEECDEIAQKAVSNRDMLFIAESLPIIKGIIHVGSARRELNRATDWVREKWGGAHPRIVLSALMFIYVTNLGAEEFKESGDSQKQAIWKRIQARVQKLL